MLRYFIPIRHEETLKDEFIPNAYFQVLKLYERHQDDVIKPRIIAVSTGVENPTADILAVQLDDLRPQYTFYKLGYWDSGFWLLQEVTFELFAMHYIGYKRSDT